MKTKPYKPIVCVKTETLMIHNTWIIITIIIIIIITSFTVTRRWVSTKKERKIRMCIFAVVQLRSLFHYSTIWWAYLNCYVLLIKHVQNNVGKWIQKCDNDSFSILKYFRNPQFGGDVNILCGPNMMDFYKTILLSFVILRKRSYWLKPFLLKIVHVVQ